MKPDAEWERTLHHAAKKLKEYTGDDSCHICGYNPTKLIQAIRDLLRSHDAELEEKIGKGTKARVFYMRGHDDGKREAYAELGKRLDTMAKDILEHSAMKKEYKYAQLTLIDDIQSLLKEKV